MPRLAIAEHFIETACSASTSETLYAALLRCCEEMRLKYFALTHHVDFACDQGSAIRLHNYPAT